MNNQEHLDETLIRDRNTATRFVVRVPASDITSCLRTPPWLALLTALGILLAVSDIPRTGSGYLAQDYRVPIRPGVAMYWGPYEYQMGHLQLMSNSLIRGTRDGENLESLDVWSYKYDTLSIAHRAIVEYLNVMAYPPCMLYRERCRSSKLDLGTAFTMLDGLVQSIQAQLFKETSFEAYPFSFATWSNWVDRLHHRIYLPFSRNPDMRSHDLYHLSSRHKSRRVDGLHICGTIQNRTTQSESFSRRAKPSFCADPIKWMCIHPTDPTSKRLVPLWDHIAIRFEDLQQRYADADLDLTMFISTLKETSKSSDRILPTINFITDSLEITTLIRGRQCSAPDDCRTVFVDDYRYERAVIESDEDEWVMYVVVLRWLSQVYVWIRVSCLFVGCYVATSRHSNHHSQSIPWKLRRTVATLLKIPGNIIVYGSWIPLIGYSLAHYLDSSLVQTIGEFAWSSVGGFYDFKPVEYVMAASVQMRNIWMVALVWKTIFAFRDTVSFPRSSPRNPQHNGVPVIRGGWIGSISWLTTFGLMRALRFRDTNVVRFLVLPRHFTASAVHVERNYSDYGIQFDVKCAFAAFVFVFSAGWLFQKLVWFSTCRRTSIFFSRSFYVPYSAGTLWSLSQLDTFWLVRFHGEGHTARVYADANTTFARLTAQAKCQHLPSTSPVLPATHSPPLKPRSCRVCGFEPSIIHWRATQGCPRHEPILDIHRRTKPLWSMVRLMNIANMTEPVALFRLYVTGKPLYVYRVISGDQAPYSVLLPMRMESRNETDTAQMTTQWATSRSDVLADSDVVFELQRIVDSRDVPWHVLVTCG